MSEITVNPNLKFTLVSIRGGTLNTQSTSAVADTVTFPISQPVWDVFSGEPYVRQDHVGSLVLTPAEAAQWASVLLSDPAVLAAYLAIRNADNVKASA